MNKFLVTLVLMSLSFTAFGQHNNYAHPDMDNFEDFVTEVYQDKADQLVFDNPAKVKELKENIKQVVIYDHKGNIEPGKYENFSTVPLFKKYNAELKRDKTIEPSNFNPLKYKFDFSLKTKTIYQVAGTDYLIIIDWSKK